MLVVAHNLSAMNSNRMLGQTAKSQKKNSEKLSSGYRINRAADDAAGLSISEKMRRQIRGLRQGSENVQDGVSLLQIADGALAEVDDMLHRMTELSVKAANGTLNAEDRQAIQEEIDHLVSEIDRVGSTTTFNERQLFADLHPEQVEYTDLKTLVISSAAEKGYLSEAYQAPNGSYYPSASFDLSAVDSSNIALLNGRGFSFTCAINCSEVFKFTFENSDNSRIEGSTVSGSGTHNYVIGIQNCQNGEEIVDAMFQFASTHPLSGASAATQTSVPVSHSNTIVQTGAGQFVLWGNTGSGYSTPAGAENHRFSSGMGRVDSTELQDTVLSNDNRTLWIQASSNEGDGMYLTIHRMNGEIIGVKDLDVTTQSAATNSISRVKGALNVINTERASLGAQQNRLEHTARSIDNTEENTTAAESRIRDADMATEMVDFSKNNILSQAGQSVLAQANQSNQGVLSLLQ